MYKMIFYAGRISITRGIVVLKTRRYLYGIFSCEFWGKKDLRGIYKPVQGTMECTYGERRVRILRIR